MPWAVKPKQKFADKQMNDIVTSVISSVEVVDPNKRKWITKNVKQGDLQRFSEILRKAATSNTFLQNVSGSQNNDQRRLLTYQEVFEAFTKQYNEVPFDIEKIEIEVEFDASKLKINSNK